jgi:hypothetical protein
VVVVVVVGGDVGGVVVGGDGGVVVGVGAGFGAGVLAWVVVVVDLPLVVVVGALLGVVVDTEEELCAGLLVTTGDHVPHSSVTFPFTCPDVVSPTNRYSALPEYVT